MIEDINIAPIDVISMLVPLLENGRLFVPERGDTLIAADGFQLFATIRADAQVNTEAPVCLPCFVCVPPVCL